MDPQSVKVRDLVAAIEALRALAVTHYVTVSYSTA